MNLKSAIQSLFSRVRSSANAIISPEFIPNNPGEWQYTSNDWRITRRTHVATPFTRDGLQQWQNKKYTHLRLRADDARRLYLEIRYTWPDDVYYSLHELQATEAEAAERGGVYLAEFALADDGSAELVVQQVPAVLGYICFKLEGVTTEERQALRSLIADQYCL
ncbi:hypothetical protein [Hymenobacter sp. B81]|uniref:hypothetical protein n=1 Tax=Hymenobacter sp. B81 TaxID=3344878 RepID=UPI0037DCA32C